MISISKLNKEDIISLCQIIGYNDILVFLNKSNISTLKYKHNKSLPYPSAFAVIIDRYTTDERVISFLVNRVSSIITKIIDDVISNENKQTDTYFTLTTAINTRFHGHDKLFCKMIGENSIKEYSQKINLKNKKHIEKGADTKMEDEILIIKQSNISLSTSRMDRNVIALLIRIAGVETASKIVPGMWMNKTKAPDETQLCDYFLKNKQGKLTNDFLIKQTKSILEEIYQNFDKYNKKYSNSLKASLQALYESPFKNHPEYYLKITNQSYSAASIKLIKEFFRLPYINFETDDSLESQKVSELNKRIQDLDNIIQQRNNESEQRYSDYEAKIAALEKSKKYAEDALIANDVEMTRLLEINKKYEEKAAANDDSSMLLSEKESLISEIKQLENRKNELSDDVKKIEEIKAQLTSQKNQLQSQLEQEIKRFSNDFVHSTAVSAILQQFTSLPNNSSQNNSVYIEMPPCDITDISHEDSISSLTDILAGNLFSIGIQKRKKEISQIIISAILSRAGLIIYGSGSNDIADALSLSLFAEYAAHVVLPTDISNIPYFLNEINKIDRNVIYIENALDSFTDVLCSSILRHCNGKIFIFAVNSYDSLKALNKSLIFEKSLFLNTEYLLDYIPNHDYKANICNLSFENDIKGTMPSILENANIKNMIKMTCIPPSIYRFWIYITAVFGSKYNIKFRNNIFLEYTIYLMMKDGLCDGSVKELYNYINENEDYKLDRLNDLLPEEETNESDN